MQTLFTSYASLQACTPSDSTQLNCRAIYVGGTGDVAISKDGTAASVTISSVPAGALLPIMLDGGRVMSTGTTATKITLLA